MDIRRTFPILVLLLWAVAAYADELQGKVVDNKGNPMPYATVFISETKRSAATDLQGQFCFDNIRPGKCRFTVSHIGYKTVEKEVTVGTGTAPVIIRMEEQAIQLGDLIVLPGGMSMEEYIIRQVNSHATDLKNKIAHFQARITYRMEKDIDLSDMPKRRTIRSAAWLMGYAKIFDAIVENKYLKLVMTENLRFNKGKMTGSEPLITEMNPQLPKKRAAAFVKHDKLLKANVYDGLYGKIKEETKKLIDAKKKGKDVDIEYTGSYQFEGKTVYILTYGRTQLHVVDECWQILRIEYMTGRNKLYYEFRELRQGVYLPVSGFAEFHFSSQSIPNGSVVLSCTYHYGP